MRFGLIAVVAIAALEIAFEARAADENTLKAFQAPPPAQLIPFESGTKPRPVKFVRVVVQLKPEPWAYLRIGGHGDGGDGDVPGEERLVTWEGGRQGIKPSTVSGIFAEELRGAGVPVDGAEDSLFGEDAAADLQVGVRVTEMQGRFCQYCRMFSNSPKWVGAVVMNAHWEIYSSLERKVVATIDTEGGFQTSKDGLDGEPTRLINEAFRDNVRRLVATDEFRHMLTGSGGQPQGNVAGALTPIALARPSSPVPPSLASKSVAIVYAADGQGSGFLVSSDGYVLTNQHVVGGSKYVKLKWANGAETLGEVVRSDRRRDVALIKTEAQGRAPLSLRTGAVQQGETVFAIGTPLDDSLQNTMTKGIVSAERVEHGLRFIQSDAAINHGNSGGPLLDEKGSVVAVAVSGILPDSLQMGLNFFIPIDDALKALALTPASAPAPVAPPPAKAAAARPLKRKG